MHRRGNGGKKVLHATTGKVEKLLNMFAYIDGAQPFVQYSRGSYNIAFFHHQIYQLPLSYTMAHFVMKFMAAGFVRGLLECRASEPRVLLNWTDYIKRLAPTGNGLLMVT